MLGFFLGLFRLVWLFGKDHRSAALENLALRQQLSIYKRKRKRLRLAGQDRWFWIALSVVWKDWRKPLIVLHPDTVVRWQRERFRRYWTRLSKKSLRVGRPPISFEIRRLIRTLADTNRLWRAPRIHGELQERSVSRILCTIKPPPSQTWRTFLQNQIGEIIAVDFFTVPTIRLRVLFVVLMMEPQRRRVVHFGVTEHPTAEWTAQQVVEAFSERDAKRYLIRDRDSIYGDAFRCRIASLSMKEVITAPPESLAERLRRTLDRLNPSRMPRPCDHVVVLIQQHLRRLLKSYFAYYHDSRTQLALPKDAPEGRAIMSRGKIVATPRVGGLHHRYERRAA